MTEPTTKINGNEKQKQEMSEDKNINMLEQDFMRGNSPFHHHGQS